MHGRGKNGVRHSQEPVIRLSHNGWSITSSVDADSPPPHIVHAHKKNYWPDPIDSTSPVLPRPGDGDGGCGGGGADNDDEITRLRKKLMHAEKTVLLQRQVIQQLCNLAVHEQSTTTPA